ncbi:MAG: L-threonylcarbamoyladenylate synthase [Sphingomonadales bacterium]
MEQTSPQRDNRDLVRTPDAAAVGDAARLLRAGKLVALPTETVYGLGADARNDRAVAAIFEAKGRPRFNPLIIHVASLEAAMADATIEGPALTLARAFWPGPLTLVLPRRTDSELSLLVCAGLDTVAVRVPAAPVARALLEAFGGPVAAPSANRSGRISPTRADHVVTELGGDVAIILDGGPCIAGVESTIVQVQGDSIHLLRPGPVTPDDITRICGLPVIEPELADPTAPVAPGQLSSHYAPRASLRLDVIDPEEDEILLGFGPAPQAALNLSPVGDLAEAAANLFTMLRSLDDAGHGRIAVSPIPAAGLGLAINDRLRRAAAPRPEDQEP